MLKKHIALLIILILILISTGLTGSFDAKSVENFAYVVAIGIDKGENNAIKLTCQFAVLNSGGNSRR